MYTHEMKRLQIYIGEDLDDALAVEAVRQKTSKAALIRRFVSERLGRGPTDADPLAEWIGGGDWEPESIDDVVYGKR